MRVMAVSGAGCLHTATATLVVALLGLAVPSRALEIERRLTHYPLDQWQSEQGLPQNTVLGIAETPDGYLWVATEEGLARFDGVSFTVFDHENTAAIRNSSLHALCTTKDGTLWFGTAGGGLGSLRGGVFRNYSVSDGLPNRFVSVLSPGVSGELWVGTYGGGLARMTGDRFETFNAARGLPGDLIVALSPGRQGGLWVATSAGRVALLQQDRVSLLPPLPVRGPHGVSALLEDGTGVLWIGTTGAGLLMRRPDGALVTPAWGTRLAGASISCLYEDRSGALWLGTEGGELHRERNGQLETLGPSQGMPAAPVRSLYEDPGGNVWVGLDGAGLVRLGSGRFTTLSANDGLSSEYVTGIVESRAGGLWVATHGGGLNHVAGDHVRSYRARDGLSSDQLWTLLEARDGTLWIGTDGRGLCRLQHGRISRYGLEQGLVASNVISLMQDRTGAIWVGTNGNGAYRIRQGGLDHFDLAAGLGSPVVHVMREDSTGGIWLGTEEGLARFADGRITRFTSKDGLPSDMVLALHEDREGVLWVGTGQGGLAVRRGGRLLAVTKAKGLFDNTVLQVLADDLGNLWMSSNKGLFRASRQELLDVAEGRRPRVQCTAYGKSDGMRSAECNGGFTPAGARLRDGRLCFPTLRGVVFVDPAAAMARPLPPKVLVERVSFSGTSVGRASSVSLPLGVRQSEIHFTGLSYTAPERVEFRYRLEGSDTDWVEAGRRRVAYYTNLRPGRHLFRVAASAGGGAAEAGGDQLELVVPPHFYETPAFVWTALLALGLSAALVYELRVRGLRRRQRQLETEVGRRTRELQEANAALGDRTRRLEGLNRELERLSTEDPLTGLANRRHFNARLEQEWRRAQRAGSCLALVSLDVDCFKEYNDAYGHPHGDACLQQLGAHLAGAFARASDLPARLGGDEFCVILADTSQEDALRQAEKLRAAFEALAIPNRASAVGSVVTLSVGAATASPTPELTAETLLRAADQALYLAKGQGRNRVAAARAER